MRVERKMESNARPSGWTHETGRIGVNLKEENISAILKICKSRDITDIERYNVDFQNLKKQNHQTDKFEVKSHGLEIGLSIRPEGLISKLPFTS